MTTLAAELVAEGYPVEFVVVSDSNASDFVDRTTHVVFREPAAGQPAWQALEPGTVKHDTFVYSRTGERTLLWDASDHSLGTWAADIRLAVESHGK